MQATSVLQNKCSREPLLQLEKPPCLVKNKPCYTCFSVKIRTFAHRSLSLTKRMNHLHNKSPVHFQLFHSSSDIYNPSDARSIFAFQRTIAVLVSMYLVVPFVFTPVFLSLRTGISLIKRSDKIESNWLSADKQYYIWLFAKHIYISVKQVHIQKHKFLAFLWVISPFFSNFAPGILLLMRELPFCRTKRQLVIWTDLIA